MFSTANEQHYYRLSQIQGSIQVRTSAFSLFSPVDLQIEILDRNGQSIADANNLDNIENPMPGGLVNYDSTASITVLAADDYIVRIKLNSRLSSSHFGGAYNLID